MSLLLWLLAIAQSVTFSSSADPLVSNSGGLGGPWGPSSMPGKIGGQQSNMQLMMPPGLSSLLPPLLPFHHDFLPNSAHRPLVPRLSVHIPRLFFLFPSPSPSLPLSLSPFSPTTSSAHSAPHPLVPRIPSHPCPVVSRSAPGSDAARTEWPSKLHGPVQ